MKSGQAMLEYVLSFAAILVVVSILWGLVGVTGRYAVRTSNLVSSEYP